MHTLEPYHNWRNLYLSEEDERSPLFGREYSEFEFTNHIYDHYIHPQWDEFGSSTLYLKILFSDYEEGFVILELLGEWNDCINNDIMFLKRNIIEKLIEEGINKFILIAENVLNFHSSDDSYYEEWSNDIPGGWIVLLNCRQHIADEMFAARLNRYLFCGDSFNEVSWHTYRPLQLYQVLEQMMEVIPISTKSALPPFYL